MTDWVTADTHFGHRNIIRYCARPFEHTFDMNEGLIARWNACVRPEDTVYHLGDFALRCGATRARDILSRLNGKIILIEGNHDWSLCRKPAIRDRFESVSSGLRYVKDGLEVWMSHFPCESWRPRVHFHGHSHGKSSLRPYRIDVGVDCWNYAPMPIRILYQYALLTSAENT